MRQTIRLTVLAAISCLTIWSPTTVSALEADDVNPTTCSVCHGPGGNSPNPEHPILAGQNAEYIFSQLKAFRSGQRTNEVMKAITRDMDDNGIAGYAKYFSLQTPISAGGDLSLVERGREKYSVCWGCHGQSGEGAEEYPRLAGQYPQYIIQQLEAFKSKSRINAAMNSIVDDLDPGDIAALGAYVSSIGIKQPLTAANLNTNRPLK